MKSSPRPPRRFSKWQTTKRNFVLGGIGPKPTQSSTTQEPRGTAIAPAAERKAGGAQKHIASGEEMGSSFDSDSTTKGISIPKRGRKLKLNSSLLQQTTDKSSVVLKEREKRSAIANSQNLMSPQRGVKKAQDVSYKSFSPSYSSSEYPASTPISSPNATKGGKEQSKETTHAELRQTSSQADESVKKNTVSPAHNLSTQTLIKSPPKRRRISSATKENDRKHRETKNAVNDSKNNFASPETAETNMLGNNSDVGTSKSTRGSHALQDVSQVANSNSTETNVSSPKSAKLRDRSKLRSSSDMLQMRQYPEKFLSSVKKPPNDSLRRGGSEKKIKNTTPPHKTKEVSLNKSSQPKSSQAKGGLSVRKNGASQVPKSKTSPRPLSKSDKSANKSSLNKTDHMFSETSPGIPVTDLQSAEEMKISQRKKPDSVKTNKRQELKRVKSNNSSSSVSRNKSMKDVDKSLTDNRSISKQPTHSRDCIDISSHSSKENFGGRSLRDRSKMPTPESLQKERQYPISFYSAKTQKDIVNSTVLSQSKSRKKTKELQPSSQAMKDNKSSNQNKEAQSLKSRQASQIQKQRSLNVPIDSTNKDKSSRKNGSVKTLITSATSKKRSPKIRTEVQPLSLPTQPRKIARRNQSGGPQMLDSPVDNMELPQHTQSSLWDIEPVSTNIFKASGAQHRPAAPQKRTESAIDETVLVSQSNRLWRKRKLVEQLSQEEPQEKEPRGTAEGSRKMFLWCEEGQSRKASDVTGYDVIFQAAVDMEVDLRRSAEDRHSNKFVQKVFSGFKSNLKSLIAQEIHLKELEKQVKERQRRCKLLSKNVSEKQTESLRLKQDIASMKTNKDIDLQRISIWMKRFTQLVQMAPYNDCT